MRIPSSTDEPEVYERILVAVPDAAHEVVVGRGLVRNCVDLVAACARAENAFVVTHPFLADVSSALETSLAGKGVEVHVLPLDEGEQSKSLSAAGRLYEELARRDAHRHDVVVALGGGVVTDVAGFVASTFNRGMPLVNVPTTLLGQVDAAIGGKNGINLGSGKNLEGTIYQPAAVLCDVDLLMTLPRVELSSGLAEVVKYGFIADDSLLDVIEKGSAALFEGDVRLLGEVVARCARIKAEVVARDERDRGVRAILNYGHTFAHAIEWSSGYGGIRHGEAVALGMMAAAHLARALDRIDEGVVRRHRAALEACLLPVSASFDLVTLEDAWRHDKKYERGVRFVLLRRDDSGGVVPEAGVDAPRDVVERALERLAE